MDLSVILCTYNRAESLRRTLETFSRLVIPPTVGWELVLVDNNSKDETRDVITEFARVSQFTVRYIFEKAQGRSNALNAGIAAATGDVLVFTDDDVLLHPDWLSNMSKTFKDFNCAAVAGRIVPVWNHPRPSWLEMEEQQVVVHFEFGDETRPLDRPPMGANSGFRRDIFEKYGLFRTDLGVSSNQRITSEDTEFGFRLLGGGEKIIYCANAIIYHPVDPSRITKSYFLRWFYNDGRSLVRAEGLPREGIFYLGIPRWLYREIVMNFFKWVSSFNRKIRFHHKLRTYRSFGRIVESWRLAHISHAAGTAPADVSTDIPPE
jgi:glucosyl-dolichyl phosphate glucuronosyltransferase